MTPKEYADSLAPDQYRHLEELVAALRSGKYLQTTGQLRGLSNKNPKETGYCCLGVACDLYDPEGWVGNTYAGRGDFPPYEVRLHFGLTEDYEIPGRIGRDYRSLVDLNDELGKSFRSIAGYIERRMLNKKNGVRQ